MSEGKRKVFIVEDDSFLAEVLLQKFSENGDEVLYAPDGSGVVEKAQAEQPSVVVLDILLPARNGLDILEELKQKEDTKNIPVVVVSNVNQSEDIARARELGASKYLVKAGQNPDDIVGVVHAILNAAQ